VREGEPLAWCAFECIEEAAGIIRGQTHRGRASEARRSDSEHLRFDIEEAELDCPQAGKVPHHPAHVRLCG
jgi:hypothetical protein